MSCLHFAPRCEVLKRSADLIPCSDGVERGASWLREDLGPSLLEALAVRSSALRRHTAAAVATAALGQFQKGHTWPELTGLLARMSGREDVDTARSHGHGTFAWIYSVLRRFTAFLQGFTWCLRGFCMVLQRF